VTDPSSLPGEPGLNGNAGQIAAHRALTELRCGRAVLLQSDAQDAGLLVASLETANLTLLARLQAYGSEPMRLALTAERAKALGHPVEPGRALLLSGPGMTTCDGLDTLAQDWRIPHWRTVLAQANASPTGDLRVLAALQLIKHAQLLPAVVCSTHNGQSDPIDVLRVEHIFIVSVLFGIAVSFERPAAASMLPAVVPTSMLQRGTALNGAAMELASIAGPALGGFTYAVSPGLPYVLTALFWLAASVFNGAIRMPRHQRSAAVSTPGALYAGIGFVRRNPTILGTIAVALLWMKLFPTLRNVEKLE